MTATPPRDATCEGALASDELPKRKRERSLRDGSDAAGAWEIAPWVLVVDADRERRRAICRVVEDARMLALPAGDVEAAWALLTREPIAFALVAETVVPDGWKRLWSVLHPRRAILVSRDVDVIVPTGFAAALRWPFDAPEVLRVLAAHGTSIA